MAASEAIWDPLATAFAAKAADELALTTVSVDYRTPRHC